MNTMVTSSVIICTFTIILYPASNFNPIEHTLIISGLLLQLFEFLNPRRLKLERFRKL